MIESKERIAEIRQIVIQAVLAKWGSDEKVNITVQRTPGPDQPRLVEFHIDEIEPISEGRFRSSCRIPA